MNTSISSQVAARLLKIGAIKLNLHQPFTWASGWHSPIYCDNRLALSYPDIRSFIKEALIGLISDKFRGAEAIAGVATAGIPQGALVAEALGLPFIYVRSKPKEHGMTNMIEGVIQPGQKVVVIEDLISTGGSSIKAALALRDAGIHVMGMAAIFTYGFDIAVQNFKEAGITIATLSNYNEMLEEALATGYIAEQELATLQAWRANPAAWGK